MRIGQHGRDQREVFYAAREQTDSIERGCEGRMPARGIEPNVGLNPKTPQ